MVLPKIKKISLLVLLVLVSFVLSAFKLISGSKGNASKAQAQCWTPSATSGWGCSTGGYPDACASSSGGSSGGCAGCAGGGGGCAGGAGCSY
jgi:hypothetical protein